MDKNIGILAIINTIAILVIPVIAVVIGQYLQNRAKKREDKMQVFKTLMTYRFFGWTNETVYALNVVDVLFAKDENVLKQWNIYKDKLTIENPTQTDMKKISDAKNKLLEIMAKSLGYNITLETIQNPYLPQGMVNDLLQRQSFQDNQLTLMEMMKKLLSNNGSAMVNVDKKRS